MTQQYSTSEVATQDLKKKLTISEKEGQEDVAAKETEELRAEISSQAGHDHCASFDPVHKIIKGFKYFLDNKFNKYPQWFQQLAEGQHPKFLVFACSDSRVSPSHVLNFQPGEAFMARNIANLVPAFNKLRYSGVGAIIEYAVAELKVENILVIGHSRCGGIQRLMSHPEDGSVPYDFIDDWVQIALTAKAKVKAEYGNLPFEEQCEICAQEAVNLSLVNLQTYPYVQRAIQDKKLALRGAHYDFVVGSLKLWELETKISDPIIIPPS
ncbi:Carbonic anhydrase 2 [Morus notabilis]|uniref:Carbonic anhydrase n=1 Tax=Morus notabilis TaxID=981085 RepID=W9S3U4_9ROSA|nr:carbonic anhydrase 2 [Morus notabilis]EXB87883.1 Carbonic anhydrase 2 [Morus notabilis]